ncbi:ParA family protein [Thioalkalivibrio sp. XN279]|uniref:ParA family protein n=1 Tax=Thioalkalivibrio sp. XN279 TaxID=2714953 RepID=UPI00140C57DE|nr:ParA family protein [Thioalkalivibrio sp. XN279]NHA13566.1 ParA family protein [Thioalkalivibrio sp. XN279]
MRTIAVANQKGGVGKTTTTVALAAAMAERGRRVLLVDLDPQGSLSAWLRQPRTEGRGVEQLFLGEPEEAAWRERLDVEAGVSILPSSPALAGVERHGVPGRARALAAGLASLAGQFEEALIDCPPSLGLPMVSALAACDRLLVPVQTEFLALEGLERMTGTVAMVERSLARKITWHIVPTLHDPRTGAGRRSLELLRSRYEAQAWPGLVPVDTSLRDAAEAGRLYAGAPGRAGQAYSGLVDWLDGAGVTGKHLAQEAAA